MCGPKDPTPYRSRQGTCRSHDVGKGATRRRARFWFTGGHRHANWGNDSFRKVVLNALLWVVRVEVPPNGVVSFVTEEDLKRNLDPK